MTLRPMTEEERRRFEAQLPPEHGWRGVGSELAVALFAALFCGMFAKYVVWIGLWALTSLPRELQVLWIGRLAWVAGLVVLVWFGWTRARWWREDRRLRAVKLADLAAGLVEEEVAIVTALHRLREPDHATELLLLETADGRVRAICDYSLSDTEGRRRSTLRLGREMQVLRLPGTGWSVTRFSGAPLRRPRARNSDPRSWPEDDGWLTPAEAEALLREA